MEKIYIFGAHSRGRTLKAYMNYLYPEISVEAFVVDDITENERIVDETEVKAIGPWMDCNISVYIATRGVYHEKIKKELADLNVKNIIPVDVELDSRLRNEYVRRRFKEQGKSFEKLEEVPKMQMADSEPVRACIYVASSAFDKPLQHQSALKPYEKCIQVGTALTEKRLEDAVYDCIGENISHKNRQYCELTGLYWLWKNAKEDYVGLEHYRRHFILPENWASIMKDNGIDVILPVPLYVAPNLADNFKGRHAAREWDCMMQYLKVNRIEDYDKAKVFFGGNLYTPCNMLIAKRQVLNDLCEWMFPILEAVVEECGEEKDTYDNRYPGFLSERLMTYFFEENRDKYKIAYADKNFLA